MSNQLISDVTSVFSKDENTKGYAMLLIDLDGNSTFVSKGINNAELLGMFQLAQEAILREMRGTSSIESVIVNNVMGVQ